MRKEQELFCVTFTTRIRTELLGIHCSKDSPNKHRTCTCIFCTFLGLFILWLNDLYSRLVHFHLVDFFIYYLKFVHVLKDRDNYLFRDMVALYLKKLRHLA